MLSLRAAPAVIRTIEWRKASSETMLRAGVRSRHDRTVPLFPLHLLKASFAQESKGILHRPPSNRSPRPFHHRPFRLLCTTQPFHHRTGNSENIQRLGHPGPAYPEVPSKVSSGLHVIAIEHGRPSLRPLQHTDLFSIRAPLLLLSSFLSRGSREGGRLLVAQNEVTVGVVSSCACQPPTANNPGHLSLGRAWLV